MAKKVSKPTEKTEKTLNFSYVKKFALFYFGPENILLSNGTEKKFIVSDKISAENCKKFSSYFSVQVLQASIK